jgi:hypothetical protein
MAKDSTAVQKLIELAQQKPIDVDLGGLFESDPPKRTNLPPPRQSMQPSGSPPPLPRTRPSGTQTALTAVPQGTPAPERLDRIEHAPDSAAAISAAEELFGGKPLPPLPVAGPAAPPPIAALPPPRRSMQMQAQPPAPAPAPPPLPRLPQIADELPTSPVSLEVDGGDWFQKSEAVAMIDDDIEGTEGVGRSRGSAVVAIAAAFGLGLVAAGGYLVYNRISSSDAKNAAPASSVGARIAAASQAKEMPKPLPDPTAAPATTAAVAAAPAPAAVQAAPAPIETAPAAVAIAAPAAPQPTVTPIEAAPAAAPTPAAAGPVIGSLIDVTLKSDPAGVTVMLIDGGGAVKLGQTPTVASLSAGTQHQILFSRDGYTATIATIDPAAQTDVMVALAPTPGSAPQAAQAAQLAAAAPAPAPEVKAAPAVKPAAIAKAAPAAKHAAPAPAPQHAKHADHSADLDETPAPAPKHAAAPKHVAVANAGSGTLMIGAKPPCDIIIDGRATGLTTPQRSINLPPGSHNITLVNKANSIKKSFSVSINAGAPTKVVKDFTSMIKH